MTPADARDRAVLPPGSAIGILGGGQLGRMTATAAAALGYRCHVFSPDADAPAKEVAAARTTAPYEDLDAVRAFAGSVDVVTFEFENVPDAALAAVAGRAPARPGAAALRVSSDRVREKSFLNDLGVETTAWAPVRAADDLREAAERTGLPAILKTARLGYDGRGQARAETARDLPKAWREIGGVAAILERAVSFEREISVVVARGVDGTTASYAPTDNVHEDGILRESRAPSSAPPEIAAAVAATAARIAEALGVIGLLAVEAFAARDGRVLVNEIAPRPHNSGHWTMDACAVGQFEQLVRAVAGLPLGDPARHSDAVMTNLLGDEAEAWPELAREPGACLRLYGKKEARPGRKMGHVTRLLPTPSAR